MTDAPDDPADIFTLIERGDGEAVAQLVAAHPSAARARSPAGVSAVLLAVYAGHPEIAALLDAAGADRDVFNAAGLGRAERLRELLSSEPQAHARWSPDGWSPLHLAAFFGHLDAVEELLRAGAAVNAVSRNGQANHPLHAACAGRQAPAALALLEGGADPGFAAAGFTPLHIAAANGLAGVVAALLAKGADPSARDPAGKVPADHAHERGWSNVERILAAGP